MASHSDQNQGLRRARWQELGRLAKASDSQLLKNASIPESGCGRAAAVADAFSVACSCHLVSCTFTTHLCQTASRLLRKSLGKFMGARFCFTLQEDAGKNSAIQQVYLQSASYYFVQYESAHNGAYLELVHSDKRTETENLKPCASEPWSCCATSFCRPASFQPTALTTLKANKAQKILWATKEV